METIVLNSHNPSKRKWTPAEDIKLVEALVEYHHEKEGKPENKFKPGYWKSCKERFLLNYQMLV